jgi:hypothetical protein
MLIENQSIEEVSKNYLGGVKVNHNPPKRSKDKLYWPENP